MKKLLPALTAALLSVASAASAQALHPLITGKPLAWLKTPNGDQMAAAYARKAHRAKVGGWAILECQVETNGDLKACQILGDGPVNIGVGEAALSLAQYFRLDVANSDWMSPISIPANWRAV